MIQIVKKSDSLNSDLRFLFDKAKLNLDKNIKYNSIGFNEDFDKLQDEEILTKSLALGIKAKDSEKLKYDEKLKMSPIAITLSQTTTKLPRSTTSILEIVKTNLSLISTSKKAVTKGEHRILFSQH